MLSYKQFINKLKKEHDAKEGREIIKTLLITRNTSLESSTIYTSLLMRKKRKKESSKMMNNIILIILFYPQQYFWTTWTTWTTSKSVKKIIFFYDIKKDLNFSS